MTETSVALPWTRDRVTGARTGGRRVTGRRRSRRFLELLEDGVLVLLTLLLLPLAILLVGVPLALLVRAVVELVQWF